jgi:hypothetical protein
MREVKFKTGDVCIFRNSLYPSLDGKECKIINVHNDVGYPEDYGVDFYDDEQTMLAHAHELHLRPKN